VRSLTAACTRVSDHDALMSPLVDNRSLSPRSIAGGAQGSTCRFRMGQVVGNSRLGRDP
jgi:hypothetical protein